MSTSGWTGSPVRRKEDPRLITGQATYTDDLRLPGMVHMALVRSPHPHARIVRFDASEALNQSGVMAVITGQEVSGLLLPVFTLPDVKVAPHPILAVDEVRYAGEPIAAVVVLEKYLAEDALEQVQVELEALPAVLDPEKALEQNAPLVHGTLGSNLAFRTERSGGDVARCFQEADRVVSAKFVHPRLAPSSLETRGVIAHFQAGVLTVWSSTQSPHLLRRFLAGILALPEHSVRVIAPEVGGAFGSKTGVINEEVLASYLAMKLGRPVKWIEGRMESFVAAPHGRGQVQWVEAAIKDDGTILGLKYRLLCDAGAYFHWIGVVGGFNTLQHALGCYRIPNVQAELSYVYTHNSTVAPYRGNGRPEGIFLLERTVDLVARELQMDPVEVRHKNLISRDSFPYKTPLGLTYDTGDYQACLDKALEAVGYRVLREEQRLAGDGPLLGVGICTYVESSAFGPSSAAASGWESARVELHRSGEVTVHTGSSPHGQGDETPFAQIAAERLGISFEDVRVLHGDTDLMPEGVGTFGSRSLVVGGSAVYLAAEAVAKKALQVAAHNLSLEPQQVLFQAGRFLAQDGSERKLSIQEVANLAYSPTTLPPGMDLGLEASAYFQPQGLTFPFGTQIAVVEVEPDTGEVRVRRLVSVEDCGRMINPRLVEGQVHGGVAQGIGEALYEAVTFEEGGQLLTSSFMQYCFPTAEMLPPIETYHTVTPTTLNPLGAKGVGESGAIGAPAAVVNAVMDALSRWGIRHLDPPLTPEKVWQAIQGAGIPEPR